jgi:hypothetical protein
MLFFSHVPDDSSQSLSGSAVYDVHNGDRRPAALVRKFGDLYSIARLDALDALDTIKELEDAAELKNKLLFSVVVVSYSWISKYILPNFTKC